MALGGIHRGAPVGASPLAGLERTDAVAAPRPRLEGAPVGRPPAPLLTGPVTARGQVGDTSHLGLAAVLDHLHRPEGRALIERLMADLLKAGLDVRNLPSPGSATQYTQLADFVAQHALPIDPYVLQRFEGLRTVAQEFPDLEAIPFRKNFKLPAHPTEKFHQVLLVHAYAVMDSVLNQSARHRVDAALPQVVISALAEAADARGRVSVARAEAVLGPRAANFLRAVAVSMGQAEGQPLPKLGKGQQYTHLSPRSAVIHKLGASRPAREDLAARMPVLAELAAHLPADFSRFEMVAVQHLFPTTGVMFDVLAEHGVDPAKSSVLGKNYSADPEVMLHLQGRGWDVVNDNIKAGIRHEPGEVMTYLDSLPEELRFHSDAQMAPVYQRLARLFEGVDPQQTDRRFLLLDEGGKLVKLLHTYFPDYAPLCVAVEQTDRGIQEVEKLQLRCPVINVARSQAKKVWESPMIGENVVAAALAQIGELAPGAIVDPPVAAVIGYGAVGKASAAALLRRGFTVHVYDTDPEKLAAAERDGCKPAASRDALLTHGHLLISATGRTTLEPADYERVPRGAILVNAASGNHELGAHLVDDAARALEDAERAQRPPRGPFDIELPALDEVVVRPYGDGQDRLGEDGRWRTQFGGHEVDLGSALDDDQMRHRVVRTPGGNEVMLLRAGYVVNLSDDIPPEFIQLTRSLIYAACAQATRAREPGLVDLSASAQEFILKRMGVHLAKAKLSLAAPDFRRVGA